MLAACARIVESCVLLCPSCPCCVRERCISLLTLLPCFLCYRSFAPDAQLFVGASAFEVGWGFSFLPEEEAASLRTLAAGRLSVLVAFRVFG